jgi:lipopolysaccharide assembly outer membrane protein LptD (OstA)
VTLTLEKHAFIKNMVLKVKDVPVFYLPAMYYPINKEDRATGFLIPIYGIVGHQGQTLSNAFFWAINRSQDATFYHSLYSKTGRASAASTATCSRRARPAASSRRSCRSTSRSATSSRTAPRTCAGHRQLHDHRAVVQRCRRACG